MTSKFILASASPRRLSLLKEIGITPDKVISPDIDEVLLKGETPKQMALRLSEAKAKEIYKDNKGAFILAADTTVACGRQLLDKTEDHDEALARQYLGKLSGRRHKVHGGICLITPEGKVLKRTCDTLVQFKPLTAQEIEHYIQSGEWKGKAGGYAIQGLAGTYVKYIAGSYSNVVGLSLYDTMKILGSGQFQMPL